MIEIDGSEGEGGGQIVRSSLALSLLTGKPFAIRNVRAGRKKPGLMRQHLTAVNAAAEVGNAEVEGASVGSREIVFRPGETRTGEYEFRISTAGSVTLVLQTVLPALMVGEAASKISLSGGTHNMMAPSFDFLARSFLPQLGKIGPGVQLQLNAWGFYPAGGGQFIASITPVQSLGALNLTERGALVAKRIRGVVSALPRKIAERETARVKRKLQWNDAEVENVEIRDSPGPGNILFAELEYENVTAVFTGFGRMGVSAESVADQVVRDVRNYRRFAAPVGPHLADQLMLPMAIAAHTSSVDGRFRTVPLTQHSMTQADIIQRFMDVEIAIEQEDGGDARGAVLVSISSRG